MATRYFISDNSIVQAIFDDDAVLLHVASNSIVHINSKLARIIASLSSTPRSSEELIARAFQTDELPRGSQDELSEFHASVERSLSDLALQGLVLRNP